MKTRISKKFFTYILQSEKDNTFYIGFTSDLNSRLSQHNSGKSTYSSSHRPYRVVYFEQYSSAKEAKDRESYIKRYGNVRRFLKSRVPPNKVRD